MVRVVEVAVLVEDEPYAGGGGRRGWAMGNKAWKLQVGERVDVVSRDRLKPHLGSMAPKAAVPPKRGRPRMASVNSMASASGAAKPGGPV